MKAAAIFVYRSRYGSQYGVAAMTASAEVLAKTEGLLPPPGLYGPWVSSDAPSWNGDYTLDYNQESQFYGVFNSNHEEHAAAYFPPISRTHTHTTPGFTRPCTTWCHATTFACMTSDQRFYGPPCMLDVRPCA